jgi:hypothetical protein
MSALSYLRGLQSRMTRSPRMSGLLKEQRASQLGVSGDELDLTFEEVETGFRDIIYTPFLSTLPSADRELLNEVTFGFLPITDPNAWALCTPSGSHLIAFHTELPSVLSFYNESGRVMSHYAERDPDKSHKIHIAAMNFIVEVFRNPNHGPYPVFPFVLDKHEMWIVWLQSFAHELFVLAHELAHVSLGHTAEFIAAPLALTEGKTVVQKADWKQQQELDADAKAVEWLYGLDKNSDDEFLSFAAQCPVLCVEVLVLFHFIECALGFPSNNSSHPPSLYRLESILSRAPEQMNPFEKDVLLQWIETCRRTKGNGLNL